LSLRSDIENTLFRYTVGFDEHDLDMLASCFTEDAECTPPSGELLVGRAAIRAGFEQRRILRDDMGQTLRHVNSNVIIEEATPISATVRSYFTLLAHSASGAAIVAMGCYFDELVASEDRWLIARRVARADFVV
jgi:hypothetical protein